MQEDNVEMTANGYVEVVRGCIASSVSSSPTCMYQQLFSLSYLGLANLTLSYTHFHLLTHSNFICPACPQHSTGPHIYCI